jgi:chromate transporter
MDLLSATNLIPGPDLTEMAIRLGFLRGGVAGLFIAGAAFILPAMSLAAFAFLYVRFGALPEISGIFYGIKHVIMSIILQALYRLSKTAIKTTLAAGLGIAVIALSFWASARFRCSLARRAGLGLADADIKAETAKGGKCFPPFFYGLAAAMAARFARTVRQAPHRS